MLFVDRNLLFVGESGTSSFFMKINVRNRRFCKSVHLCFVVKIAYISLRILNISRQNVTRGGGVYGFRNSETFFSV